MTEESAEWQALDRELAPDHQARQVKAFVDQMDLTLLYADYAGVGSPACDPRCLIRMILYETLLGRTSPAEWLRSQADGHATLKWLGMGVRPSRSTWYNYRDRLGPLMEPLNVATIQQAHREGHVQGDVGVQDGTLLRACATRHHLLNRERLDRRLGELRDAVKQDADGVAVKVPQWMAQTVSGRRRQLLKFNLARQTLEKRLAQNARRASDKRQKEKHVVVSTSDPEAAPGRDKEKVFCALYNVQYIVDPQSLLIMAYSVFSQATDAGTLAPMLDRVQRTFGQHLKRLIADAGYVSILDLRVCEERAVQLIAPYQENDFTAAKKQKQPPKQLGKDQFTWLPEAETYVCPQGHQLQRESSQMVVRRESDRLRETVYRCDPVHCRECPLKVQCSRDPEKGRTVRRLEGEELLTEHQRQMETPEAKQFRRSRGSIIERPFADLKTHRKARRLHGRGLSRVQAEVGLLVMAQNLLALHRLRNAPATPCANTT